MTETKPTKRQKRVRTHNVATIIAFGTFIAIIGEAFGLFVLTEPVVTLVVIGMLGSVLVMFATRNADEYTASLWRIGTSAAFVCTVAIVHFVPFFEGFLAGLTDAPQRPKSEPWHLSAVSLLGFYFIANALARIRGTV